MRSASFLRPSTKYKPTSCLNIRLPCIILVTYIYINNFSDTTAICYTIVFAIEVIILALILPFLFPLIACYKNTFGNTFKNAFLLSVSNLDSWLKITLAWIAPISLSIIYPAIFLNTWYLWLLIVFGFIGYGSSFTINKVFHKIADIQIKNAEKEKTKRKLSIRERALLTSFSENQDKQ